MISTVIVSVQSQTVVLTLISDTLDSRQNTQLVSFHLTALNESTADYRDTNILCSNFCPNVIILCTIGGGAF